MTFLLLLQCSLTLIYYLTSEQAVATVEIFTKLCEHNIHVFVSVEATASYLKPYTAFFISY